ncbi:MAG: multidrug ABC transporter substrate-binding protein [Deltaproteobacteria bacterium RIFCSPLOWO2_02_FULL_57_26]|nr:MAG: multidrug ABC transporter substrate-binding protein [Deltaproteobacteria bacterium RIFCSPLOWO2_02_FULL_57_26]
MWFMTLRIALRALGRNKLRSFLTMLGIIIGVGAVIAMVAIGEGAKATIRSQIASLGTNVLIVLPGTSVQGGVRTGSGGVNTLVDSDAKAMMQELPSVAFASPALRRPEQVVAGNLNWSTLAQGVAPEFQQIRDWQVAEGRFLHEGDMESAAKVAVVGQTVVDQLFGNDDPIDSVLRIRNIPFRVVGVLAPKGQSSQGTDQDDTVMIPYTTMQKRLMRITWVQSIVVSAVSAERVQEAQEQISLLLRQRHRIGPDREDDFTIRNLSDIAEAASASARVMAVLLGSVASISLLVGGIGIMNIMLVSVTERTREIGIRMAVGARSRDIMFQFLVEAVVMAASGGLIGILLGIGSSVLLNRVAQWPTLISPEIVAVAFFFSGAVGVFFGFYPAQKAAHLDPIDALRYE